MREDDQLQSLLPPLAQARLQSARLADGIASIIIDVAGLDRLERDRLEIAIKDSLRNHPEITDIRIGMTADKRRRKIVAVGSGKGGVGKSTLSANLAVALARQGIRTGLVDADIYGPSQPRLLGNEGQRPDAREKKLVPVPSEWGVSVLSMGHLVEAGKAIAWRGPMAGNALSQLVDAHWDDADVLIVDLPPGTGDVQLTMLQRFKPDGAVIVSTPQDLALMDAERAMQLFVHGNVPIIGLVENMAGYSCPHCGEISDPFGQGGAEAAANRLGHAFLGRIPLDLAIRQASDAGSPPAARDDVHGEAFAAVARRLATWLGNQPG